MPGAVQLNWLRRQNCPKTASGNPQPQKDKYMIPTPPVALVKRRIKRFAPLQLGLMLAVLYGVLGLIFIPFFLIFTLVASHLPRQQNAGFMAMGVGFILLFPILYAIMGFVLGVIMAWVYNLAAKWVGGIEVEVE